MVALIITIICVNVQVLLIPPLGGMTIWVVVAVIAVVVGNAVVGMNSFLRGWRNYALLIGIIITMIVFTALIAAVVVLRGKKEHSPIPLKTVSSISYHLLSQLAFDLEGSRIRKERDEAQSIIVTAAECW